MAGGTKRGKPPMTGRPRLSTFPAMPPPRHLGLFLAVATSLVACSRGPSPNSAPSPPVESLSGIAAQRVVLLPTYTTRVAADLDWRAAIGPARDVQRALDAEIKSALDERGAGRTWTLPEALAASYKRNPTYATDPYTLAEEPLRSP